MGSAAREGRQEFVALVDSPDHVCCRYRILPFENVFAEAGFHLRVEPWPSSLAARLSLIFSLQGKLVLLQRKLISTWLVWLMRKQGIKLLFDFDDAVFYRDSYSGKGFEDVGRFRRFSRICESASAIIAGNHFLAKTARKWNPSKVFVIPTCVDADAYSSKSMGGSEAKELSLVWIGSSSTLPSLGLAREGLESVGANCPGVQLKVICDKFPEFSQLPVDSVPWTEATEVKDICAADVGFAWMPSDPWSQGKCGLKVLQYMAAGLPVIANPVGVHKEMVVNGETGFLVKNTDELIHAVRTLKENPAFRRTMGKKGREKLEKEFSLTKGMELWRDVLFQTFNQMSCTG